jgi:hypothetical protein
MVGQVVPLLVSLLVFKTIRGVAVLPCLAEALHGIRQLASHFQLGERGWLTECFDVQPPEQTS